MDELTLAKVLMRARLEHLGFYPEEWEEVDADKQAVYLAQARAAIAAFAPHMRHPSEDWA